MHGLQSFRSIRVFGQGLREIKALLKKHQKVFGDIPPGRPLDRGFEHTIELEEGTGAVITTPYRHPKAYKDEIEKTIKELLAMGTSDRVRVLSLLL